MIVFSGCGKPTIDTSSDESFKASMEKVKASLPEDKHNAFEEAVQIVVFSDLDISDFWQAAEVDTGAAERKMKAALEGRTGEEIIALAAQLKAEEEEYIKEQSAKLLTQAKQLEKEGDLKRALNKYREAHNLDPDNQELQSIVLETEKTLRDNEEAEKKLREKLRKVLYEAERRANDDSLDEALAKYKEALSIDENSQKAIDGIEKTTERIKDFKFRQKYIQFLKLYDFKINEGRKTTYGNIKPSLEFKIKNEGEQTLEKVKVIVYFRDKDGNTIFEEDYYPVLVSDYPLSANNKPLKAGYITESSYYIKGIPSEWEFGNAEAVIADLRFATN